MDQLGCNTPMTAGLSDKNLLTTNYKMINISKSQQKLSLKLLPKTVANLSVKQGAYKIWLTFTNW